MRLQRHFITRSGQAQNDLEFEGMLRTRRFWVGWDDEQAAWWGNVASSLLAFTNHSRVFN